MTDEQAAEEYLQVHGRVGGSSLKTVEAFLAGCTYVRTSAAEKERDDLKAKLAVAVEALTEIADLEIEWVAETRPGARKAREALKAIGGE